MGERTSNDDALASREVVQRVLAVGAGALWSVSSLANGLLFRRDGADGDDERLDFHHP